MSTRTFAGGPRRPACVTVTVLPPTVNEPVRIAFPRFGAMAYVRVPLPVPGPLSVIHDGVAEGDQAQPG